MSEPEQIDPFAQLCALEFLLLRLLADRLSWRSPEVAAKTVAALASEARREKWTLPPEFDDDYPARVANHVDRLLHRAHRMALEPSLLKDPQGPAH